jgi:hypothetical protein
MHDRPPIDENHPLCGTWRATDDGGDEYLRAEYSVKAANGQFHVSAIDRSDNERFVITDVNWDGEWLSFSSFVPSTERRGQSRIRYLDTHEIEFFFTFTVREVWRKRLKK